ncbi:hypothetical protein Tco_0969163 [Tanacetum coccineum]
MTHIYWKRLIAGGHDNAVDKDVDEQPLQDLALNVDNVFQADDYDAFDSDVNEAPTTQTMFMANLSSADPVYDEAGPSYDSDILSEVHDHDQYWDAICKHHEEHEMHDDVQPNYVVDSHANYTSDSNMIPYDQYVKDNAVPVVQSNVSFVLNDPYMIYNDMYEPHGQSVSKTTRNTVVDNSLTAELATYKEHVELYERRARPLLCLTHAKQVQPALYNGHEIIKTNHVPAIVHNSEDTLEIVEITRKKINAKMKDPECVQKKVKITPPDYSKENYSATFTPQKQLTPEQILWSQDLIKMKAKALKMQATASRPIKALMVYSPNTPATLVPRVLPIKKHFEGIQKALTKEIKEMKDIFEELEAEVDQNGVDRKHDEIERKNLLIANDNLIADCLSKEVFYVVMNSELNVSSFTEMHDAHTSLKARCLELEVELSNLLKISKFLGKVFGNHQYSKSTQDVPDFDSVFVIEKMKALIQGKDNAIKNLRMQISQLNETRSEADRSSKTKSSCTRKYAIDVQPIPHRNRNNRVVHLVYLKHLKESVETLREIVEEAKAERPLDRSLASACRYTKHSQELLEYVIDTCPKALNTRDNKHASTSLPKKKQVTFEEQCAMSKGNTHKPVEQLNCQKTNVHVPPSIGVNSCTDASRSQPRSNTKAYLAIVLQKAKQIQDFGPTSGIRASRGTLTSYHEDASENGTATNKPKQQQQQLIPTTTTISNIKLLILKKEEYDIWAMEMEHYLEYIDNDVWKVIQNGNSKKRISTGKDGVVRILPPVSAAEIHVVEKERKARTILLMAIPKEHLRRFHGMDDAKKC